MGTDHLGLGAAGRSYGAAAPELLHKLAFATPALVLHLHLHQVAKAFSGEDHCIIFAAGQIRGYSSERSFCTLGRWKSADWESDSLLTSLLFFLYYPIRNLVRLVSSRSVPFGAFGPDYMYSP
ncbi:hypothetical protein DTO063F5_1327 [Paecilomyces variotii]|nr:hypothetical protein DTO063F5_1327 [Paecilomyces variotii]